MITTDRLNWFSETLAKSLENLPNLIAEMRETAHDRERLLLELAETGRVQDQMNVTISDLHGRLRGLDTRVHELLIQNAKLERLIMTAGEALRGSTEFVQAAEALARPKPRLVEGGF